MWREAQMQWQQRQQAGAARGAPTAPAQGAPTAPATGATSTADKAPKQLPAHIWQRQVARYNAITVDGRPRRFPEKEVLGAEQVHWPDVA